MTPPPPPPPAPTPIAISLDFYGAAGSVAFSAYPPVVQANGDIDLRRITTPVGLVLSLDSDTAAFDQPSPFRYFDPDPSDPSCKYPDRKSAVGNPAEGGDTTQVADKLIAVTWRNVGSTAAGQLMPCHFYELRLVVNKIRVTVHAVIRNSRDVGVAN